MQSCEVDNLTNISDTKEIKIGVYESIDTSLCASIYDNQVYLINRNTKQPEKRISTKTNLSLIFLMGFLVGFLLGGVFLIALE